MKRLLTNALLTGWVLATAVLSAGGCGGGSGSVTVPMPQTASDCHFMGNVYEQGNPMFDKCCQLDPSSQKPVPKTNPDSSCTPGYGGAAMTGMGFTNAGSSAGLLAGNAMDLSRNQGAVSNNQSAATAATSPGANDAQKSGDAAPAGSAVAPGPMLGAGSGSGSGGSVGGSGGGLGSSGLSMTGTTLSAAAPRPGQQEVSGEDKNGGYEGSGGGRRGGASSSSGGFDLAGLLGGGGGTGAKGSSGAQAKDLKFGRGLAGDGSALGSADPDMYFSLLNPEDNLFKIVERRYQTKQQQWAVGDAQKAVGQVLLKP